MNFTNGLAKDEFLQHMFEEFSRVFDNTFSRTMLENIVDYCIADNFTHTKNGLFYFLKDMIPEVEPGDLIPYIDKSYLTHEVLSLVDMDKFLLSRDTDFGADLMQFISDYRVDFEYSGDDLDEIGGNKCFGLVMLRVQEYLDDEDIAFDDINFGRYSSDKRVADLIHVVDRAFHEYLDGEYDYAAINSFIENVRISVEGKREDKKTSLSDQILSAATRASEAHSTEKTCGSKLAPER